MKQIFKYFINIVKAIPVFLLNTYFSSLYLHINKITSNNCLQHNNKKTFIERTRIGVKRGLTTPTLSKEMLEFQIKPLIRILRVVGGMSFICILNPTYKLHGIFL
jgi:hypothetical protein